MQLDVRIDSLLPALDLRTAAQRRARLTLSRLQPRLAAVTIDVSAETRRGPGRVTCRVSGTFADGGALHVTSGDPHAYTALALTLEKFRRTGLRLIAKRRSGPVGRPPLAHARARP